MSAERHHHEGFKDLEEASSFFDEHGVTLVRGMLDTTETTEVFEAIQTLATESPGKTSRDLERAAFEPKASFDTFYLEADSAAHKEQAMYLHNALLVGIGSISTSKIADLVFINAIDVYFGAYPAQEELAKIPEPKYRQKPPFHVDPAMITISQGDGYFHTMQHNDEGQLVPLLTFPTSTGDVVFTDPDRPLVHAGQGKYNSNERRVLSYWRSINPEEMDELIQVYNPHIDPRIDLI